MMYVEGNDPGCGSDSPSFDRLVISVVPNFSENTPEVEISDVLSAFNHIRTKSMLVEAYGNTENDKDILQIEKKHRHEIISSQPFIWK